MQRVRLGRLLWTSLVSVLLVACGGSGDEYEGFDNSVTLDTPNRFLSFLNRQGDLPAGQYTLVVGTASAGASGTFSIMLTRNDGSDTELINGSWSNSGGQDSDPDCASGNRCYDIDMRTATGLMIEMSSSVDGVLYLVSSNGSSEVLASRNSNGAGNGEMLDFAESDIDQTNVSLISRCLAVCGHHANISPTNRPLIGFQHRAFWRRT